MPDTGPKALGEVLKPYTETECITAKSGAAITKGAVVKLSAAMGTDGVPTVVITAANTDIVYGVALDAATASGQYIRVLKYGWVKITAVEAITAGVQIRAAAGGKAGTTGTGPLFGYAETAASADNDTFMAFVGL